MTLHGVAEKMSAFRLTISRAFEAAVGRSLMNYARGRKLAEESDYRSGPMISSMFWRDASILAVALKITRLQLAWRVHSRVSRRVRRHARSVSPKSGAIRASIDRARSNGQIKTRHRPRPAALRKRREALHRCCSIARYSFEASEGDSRSMATLQARILAHVPGQLTPRKPMGSPSASTTRGPSPASLASRCVIFRRYRENSRPS